MKNVYDLAKAREIVAKQLKRPDIGNTQQRAMLIGLMTALQWVDEVGDIDKNVLQQLIDGRTVLAHGETVHECFAREQSQKSRKNRTLSMIPDA